MYCIATMYNVYCGGRQGGEKRKREKREGKEERRGKHGVRRGGTRGQGRKGRLSG